MPLRVTNRELFNTCYEATHAAADRLVTIKDGERERGEPLTVAQVTEMRNLLRRAHSAAQELKTRLKQAAQP